jgi:O-antigen ligase
VTDQPRQSPAVQGSTPGSAVGFLLLLALLFAVYSRLLDFLTVPLRIIAFLAAGAALVALISGSLFRAIRHPITLCLLAFTAWAGLTIPLSVWPGGSFDTLITWLRSLLVFGLITAFTTTYSRLLTVVKVIAIALLVLTGLTYVIGTTILGRLSMSGSKFGNPNDLAQILLMAMPLWWFLAFRPGVALLWRLLSLVCLVLVLGALVKTGSRAGLLAFAIVLLAVFFLGSSKRRIPIALGTLAVMAMSFLFLPDVVRQRYFTLFGRASAPADDASEAEEVAEEAATASASARQEQLKESLAVTIHHPVFGVGLGQFMVAQNELAQDRGQRGSWSLTHNMYTQISSENGIPGLIFYLGAMLGCWRALRRAAPRRRAPTERPEEASILAENLVLTFVAFAVTGLFSSVAYEAQFPVLAGMAVVLSRLDLTLPAASPQRALQAPGGAARAVPRRAWRTPASVRPTGAR